MCGFKMIKMTFMLKTCEGLSVKVIFFWMKFRFKRKNLFNFDNGIKWGYNEYNNDKEKKSL